MDLRNRGRCQRFNREIVKPGLYGKAAHRLFNLLFRQPTIEGRYAILQQRELIGDLRREQIAAGREHLTELDPHRPQLLQRKAQTFAEGLVFMTIRHPEQHPPPDTQRQRDTHFGNELIKPIAQKGADNKIQAP